MDPSLSKEEEEEAEKGVGKGRAGRENGRVEAENGRGGSTKGREGKLKYVIKGRSSFKRLSTSSWSNVVAALAVAAVKIIIMRLMKGKLRFAAAIISELFPFVVLNVA